MSVRKGGKIIAGITESSISPGFIQAFAGSTPPTGWLICDGSAIDRTDYAGLFAVIGTTYGVGDGNSTFNLPDLNGRLPVYDSAATIGATSNGGLPSHTHTIAFYRRTGRCGSGTTHAEPYSGTTTTSGPSYSSAIETTTGVIPANVKTLWCIKY